MLKTLHDELDAAVLDAYGWSDLTSALANPEQKDAAGETLLVRLVALNAERAAEEARGQVRWLRPEYQHPAAVASHSPLAIGDPDVKQAALTTAVATSPSARQAWPAALPEQVAAVAKVLAAAAAPLSEAELAARFTGKGAWKKRLAQIVDTLDALGRVRHQGALLASAG